jgi:osmoprotectant transport system substrate-binding protein
MAAARLVPRRSLRAASTAWLVAAIAFLVACGHPSADAGSGGAQQVRVASFDFVESRIIAEIYAQALQAHGVPVKRVLGLGSREVVQPALQAGLVDVVPEYSGSALHFLSPNASGAQADVADAQRLQLEPLLAPHHVTVLRFSAAQDRNGVVVSTATARARGLRTISDMAKVASSMRFGGPPECAERPLCLPGLSARYGINFQRFVPLGDPSAVVVALNAAEIDVGLLDTSDPNLQSESLTLLVDDKHLQPAEYVVPVVRDDVVEQYGQRLRGSLDAISAVLTTKDLVSLNAKVQLQRRSVSDAASEWLAAHQP